MNQKIVSLGTGEKLVVEWLSNWSNLTIHKAGALIGSVQDKADLRVGKTFMIPDGRKITAVLTNNGLEVWCDGIELMSGMKTGTVDGFGRAYKALFFMGILVMFGGGVMLVISRGFGLIETLTIVLIGAFWLGLGFWAKKSGNKAPIWVGIAIVILMMVQSALTLSLGGLLIPGIVLYYLYQGTKYEPIQSSPTFKPYQGANAPLDSDL